MFAVGAGVGYVLGTRAGRERYEAMKTQADNLWHDPRVQDKVAEAGQAVKEKAPEVQAKLASAAGTVKDNVTETVKEKVADVKGADKPADADTTSSTQAVPPSIDGAEMVGGLDTGAAASPQVPQQQTP